MRHTADHNLAKLTKKLLRIPIKKKILLESALTHPSYRNEHPCPKLLDFDRLEFFGDSILNFVICQRLYHLYPEANEGMLSKMRSILVSRKILSRIAKDLHFLRLMKLGRSLHHQPVHMKTKILADSFESFLSAIYFDHGIRKTERFILKHYRPYFNVRRLFRLDSNPKSTLQELCQKKWQRLPVYENHIAPHGMKTTVSLGRMRRATATGRTRQESEEKAARLLIRKIRQTLLRDSKRASSGKKLRKTF